MIDFLSRCIAGQVWHFFPKRSLSRIRSETRKTREGEKSSSDPCVKVPVWPSGLLIGLACCPTAAWSLLQDFVWPRTSGSKSEEQIVAINEKSWDAAHLLSISSIVLDIIASEVLLRIQCHDGLLEDQDGNQAPLWIDISHQTIRNRP
jgi:hypothetical protein